MAMTKVLVLFASALLLSMLFAGVDSTRSNETWHEHAVENPDEVAAMVDMSIRNSTRAEKVRLLLMLHRDGRYYVVSDPNDDNPVNPKPGTLRHAVIQEEPLWIVFKRDMVIN
ncbi:putative pectate lyase 20 [Raphanus sativus]|nr:putative pectate lyase 20 [Raphanus sativus]